MSPKIPILSLRLFDLSMPDQPSAKKGMLNGAKDLLRAHQPALQQAQVDSELFHNKEIRYSGIQLGRIQGAPEWTAIGAESVKTLQAWYDLFKTASSIPLQNTVEIIEQYTPAFLPKQKKYRLHTLLINDQLAKKLQPVKDKYTRYDMLERYLYGNLQNFFSFIGFQHDKSKHFLKVSITEIKPYKNALPVYHHQKKTAFQVAFQCNFRLPQTLRLGQSTAIGYGKLDHQ